MSALRWLACQQSTACSSLLTQTRSYVPRPRYLASRRFFSEDAISNASKKVQIYISRSSDPYLNLSIEHLLLQKSHPDSVILLLYTNKPCVVIGRNQNPWVEVNLGLLKGSKELLQPYIPPQQEALGSGPLFTEGQDGKETQPQQQDDVQLVRRRSGGGTVFHDAGNLNWSIICPPAIFDRDKHAEMIVRALRGLPLEQKLDVKVNERHDIVMDVLKGSNKSTFKISGSAYKLTRLRSLHHGTLLLSSPNLPVIGQFLRSPAEPYIKARGVESVRSPIHNVGLSNIAGSAFEIAVVAEFSKMYNNYIPPRDTAKEEEPAQQPLATPSSSPAEPEIISSETANGFLDFIPAIKKGYDELISQDWIFTQTPQFTFSTHPTVDDTRPRPEHSDDRLSSLKAHMTVRHGEVTGADIDIPRSPGVLSGEEPSTVGTKLHEVKDWRSTLNHQDVGKWFNKLFGITPH